MRETFSRDMMTDDTPNTPPLSPMMLDDDFQDSFPFSTSQPNEQFTDANTLSQFRMFNCHGNRSNTSTKIYVDNLKRCLMQNNETLLSLESSFSCFGCTIASKLFPENMSRMFLFLRQWIGRFQINGLQSAYNYQQLREDIVTFLDFVKTYLLSLPVSEISGKAQFLQCLVNHLHSTFLYMDRLADLRCDKNVGGLEHSYFHMCLDLYWQILEILHIINVKFTEEAVTCRLSRGQQEMDGEYKSAFDQMMQVVLWDLVTMALHIYRKMSSKECLSISPFICPCVSDLWTMVIVLLGNQQTSCHTEGFWLSIHDIIQVLLERETCTEDTDMDSDVYVYPDQVFSKGDYSNFALWLIVHLSDLDRGENKLSKSHTQGNYHDVTTLMRKCLSKGDLAESELRFYIQICLRLATTWGPNIGLLVLLWDYFYRRLNNGFQASTSSVDGLATVSKTPSLLVETCTRLSSKDYVCKPQDNSYQMFLGLLCSSLRAMLDEGSSQEWKQMKGRVYSKFHMRRIQELREVGLHNFCCLFISLALTADLEDVSNKMCDFCDMVELSWQHVGRKMTVWRGMFAVAIIYIQRKLDISFLANKLVKNFSSVCSEFDLDTGNRFTSWRLISAYLEGVQEVIDRSDEFCYSQHILIGDGVAKLLSSCRSNELSHILTVLLEIVSKLRMVAASDMMSDSSSNKELFSSLMTHVCPPLKELSHSQTPLPLVADLLAGLCLSAIQLRERDCFSSLTRFCIGESVDKNVTSRFLSQILPVPGVLEELSQCLPSHQSVLIQAWVRCVTLVPGASTELSCMFDLREVKEIFELGGMEFAMETEKRSIFQFFKAIQAAYSNIQGWKERIALRDKVMMYFADIHKQISAILHALQPVEALHNVYAVIGYLVKCCAPLIFVQSKPDCPLPNIINSTIVPHIMFNTEKTASPVFLNVVRDHLHLFVIGLSKLEYKKAPYVQRRLGDIFSIYLPRFWNLSSSGSSAVMVHPLVASLKDSFVRQPTEGAVNFRAFVLDLVNSRFLQSGPLMLASNYQYALQYIKEIVNRTTKRDVIAGDAVVVLHNILKIQLLSESQNTLQTSHYIIQQLMESVCQYQEQIPRKQVCDILLTFVGTYKKTHLEGSLKTLEKIPQSCAPYIQDIIKELQHYVVEHEANRGVGTDTKIRATFMRLFRTFKVSSETVTL